MPSQATGQITVAGLAGALLSQNFTKPDTQGLVEITGPSLATKVNIEGTQDGVNWFGVLAVDTNTATGYPGASGTGGVTLNPVLASQAFKVDVTNLTQLRVWQPILLAQPLTVLIRTDAFFSPSLASASISTSSTSTAAETLAGVMGQEEPLGMNKMPITLDLRARPDPFLIGSPPP